MGPYQRTPQVSCNRAIRYSELRGPFSRSCWRFLGLYWCHIFPAGRSGGLGGLLWPGSGPPRDCSHVGWLGRGCPDAQDTPLGHLFYCIFRCLWEKNTDFWNSKQGRNSPKLHICSLSYRSCSLRLFGSQLNSERWEHFGGTCHQMVWV